MPTYTDTIAATVEDYENKELLSLSLLPRDPDIPAWIQQDYVGKYWSYTACHDVAASLIETLGTGGRTSAVADEAVTLARTAVGQRGKIIHFRYKHPKGDGHSFCLLSTADSVESLEGWAGADADHCLPFFYCVLNRPKADISHATAREAIGNMRNANKRIRGAAFDAVSRAGLAGFEDHYAFDEMVLEVTVRNLKSKEQVALGMGNLVGAAARFFDVT